ncbi:MAG: 2Fe-2S iron-sulfur cluster-binding protein [Woeseia sp.]
MIASNATTAREYRVTAKVEESELITSFYLQPVDAAAIPPFLPGQFLTLDLDATEQAPLRRTYSISCGPKTKGQYRISVKREPHGAGSGFLHREVKEGSILAVHDPKGHFVLAEASSRPVLLLSGGVGLTPMVSMLHALSEQPSRKVWFIHACDNGKVHAFGNEVRSLANRFAHLNTHFCYRAPAEGDTIGRDFDSEGLVNRALLQRLLPLDDYEVYLCGPTPFMQAMYELLCNLGVSESSISYEFFGDGEPLQRSSIDLPQQAEPPLAITAADAALGTSKTPLVTFSSSKVTARWDPAYASLLEFAEAQGLAPDFSCRSGVCNTCECELSAGELTYSEEPLCEPAAGRVLICCSIPTSDITLNL